MENTVTPPEHYVRPAVRMTAAANRWTRVGIWLGLCALAVFSCCVNLSSTRMNGEYLPIGNDGFYHARRILDTAQDPSAFYQFDSHIHAPEGSLLVWPWGYDYALAWIVRIGMRVGLSTDPVAILIWIPVAAVLIALGLFMVIARQLSLSIWMTTVGGLCMALAPTTQLLFGIGQVDHHYAELLFVLATLGSGLAWMRQPDNSRSAALMAVVLGIAPAIHNALFILQIPLLICLFAMWVQQRSQPVKASGVFAVVLLLSTLAILIPSLPFRLGRFEFYTLCWFHLYIAACTATMVVLMSRAKPTLRGFGLLAASALVLLIPIIGQVTLAREFLEGSLEFLQPIGEMQSPLNIATTVGTAPVSKFYSYLIWLAPLTWILCLVQCWRDRASPRLLLWISAVLGLVLLSMQLRMHYFGDFALYVPWLIVVQDLVTRRPEMRNKAYLLVSMALLLLYVPSLRYQLVAPMARGNDLAFANIRPIFTTLRKACAEDPGIVLADGDAGHYIRYYTDCSVIANNFLLTPQQMRKSNEAQHLNSISAQQLEREAPQVKYVLVRPGNIGPGPNGQYRYTFFIPKPVLAFQLLLGKAGSVPPDFKLLDEVRFAELNNIPYARLYKIEPGVAQGGVVDKRQ